MANEAHQTLHTVIAGRVQGVNFRHHAAVEARKRGLTGWVRNRDDGTVETLATGTRTALEQFLIWLHRGSPAAEVTRVESHWSDTPEKFERFEIRS